MITKSDINPILNQAKDNIPQIVLPSTTLIDSGLTVIKKIRSEVPLVDGAIDGAKDLAHQGLELVVSGAEELIETDPETTTDPLPVDEFQDLDQSFAETKDTVEGTMIAAQELNEVTETTPWMPRLWRATEPLREFGIRQITNHPMLKGPAALIQKGAELLLPSQENESIIETATREALRFVNDVFGNDEKGQEDMARYIRSRQAMIQNKAAQPFDEIFVSAELSGIYDEILIEDEPTTRSGTMTEISVEEIVENEFEEYFTYTQSSSDSKASQRKGAAQADSLEAETVVAEEDAVVQTAVTNEVEPEVAEEDSSSTVVSYQTAETETEEVYHESQEEVVVEKSETESESIPVQTIEVTESVAVLEEDSALYLAEEQGGVVSTKSAILVEGAPIEEASLSNSSVTTDAVKAPSIAAEESLTFSKDAITYADDDRVLIQPVDQSITEAFLNKGSTLAYGVGAALGFVAEIFNKNTTQPSYLAQLIQNQQSNQDPYELPQYGFVFIASGMYLLPAREKQAGIRDNVESKMAADAMNQKLYTVSDNEDSQGGRDRDAREAYVASVEIADNDVEDSGQDVEEEIYISVPAADVVV